MPDAFGYATPEELQGAFGNPLLSLAGPNMRAVYDNLRSQAVRNQGQEALGIEDLVRSGQKPEPTMLDKLLGLGGVERYQTWPERMVRSAVTLPQQVYSGEVPVMSPETGHTAEPIIQRAQDVAGMAMGGSLPAAERGALGSGGGRSYSSASDNLMGFGKKQPPKGFHEERYKTELPVEIKFPDGEVLSDTIKGLNKPHALERAFRNWPDATEINGTLRATSIPLPNDDWQPHEWMPNSFTYKGHLLIPVED